MRITQEMLLKVAEDAVTRRVDEQPEIIAAYLYGSVLEGEPVLGGAADIDLVYIYAEKQEHREVLRLTADVHLDIHHHGRALYEPARVLRTDPRWGAALYACRALYDPQHFIDFTQAGVRGMYASFDNVWGRAYPLLQAARQTWMDFHNHPPELGRQQVWDYLGALENIVNAVSFLSGGRLGERRLLEAFPAKAEAIGQPGLYFGLLGLLGAGQVDPGRIRAWVPDWQAAYERGARQPDAPVALHEDRLAYYLRAVETFLEGERPQDALWPLLRTWTLAVMQLPSNARDIQTWTEACEQLGLTGEGFTQRFEALDAFLEMVEEYFEEWKSKEAG